MFKVVRFVGLGIFALVVFTNCNKKKNVLVGNDPKQEVAVTQPKGLSLSEKKAVFVRAESYTPALVSRSADILLAYTRGGKKLDMQEITAMSFPTVQRMEKDGFSVLPFDTTKRYFVELLSLLRSDEVDLFVQKGQIEQWDENVFDQQVLRAMDFASTQQERRSVAFYGSLFKSSLLFAQTSSPKVDALRERIGFLEERYKSNVEAMFKPAGWRCFRARAACRIKYMADVAGVGAVIGAPFGVKGAAIGGSVGAVVGIFVGNCGKQDVPECR